MRADLKAMAWRTFVAMLAAVLVDATVAAAQSREAVITPVEWPRPVYPQIAQSARVSGDVEVGVDVRPDGTVASARAVSGPPLLHQAAEDAVRRVRFDCRGCTEAITRYSLYVTFRLSDVEHPPEVAPLVVSPTQGWVTVAVPFWRDPLAGSYLRSVRGIKCVYLWRCEWPPQRARGARCLWLWPCGKWYRQL